MERCCNKTLKPVALVAGGGQSCTGVTDTSQDVGKCTSSQRGDPGSAVSERLAKLLSEVTWKTGNVCNELRGLAKKISRQNGKSVN